MASSTADIVAACRATASALGRSLLPETISGIAGRIEPSDGLMYPGVVCYNHRACRLIEPLGAMPPLDILAVDLGGEVDTLAFNSRPKHYSPAETKALQRAYDWVKAGLQTGDLALVGRAATLSGRINQRLLQKLPLEALIRIAEKRGAIGVNVAHSGTVVGLLFRPGQRQIIQQTREEILVKSELTPPRFWSLRTLAETSPSIDGLVPCAMQERMMS
jgi:L-threonine kinase